MYPAVKIFLVKVFPGTDLRPFSFVTERFPFPFAIIDMPDCNFNISSV